MVNVVEKYIENKKQLIILISGFSGSGKTMLARNIERDFKINFLNLNDFYKKDYENIVDLGNDIKVNDWDNPDAVDWEMFNKKVNELNTVVISGFGFPNNLIDFKPDFHIYVKISKQKLIENRQKFKEDHENNQVNDIQDPKIELLILNNLSYKHFMYIKENSTYTYSVDVSEKNQDESYDDVFEYLIKDIEKFVYKK